MPQLGAGSFVFSWLTRSTVCPGDIRPSRGHIDQALPPSGIRVSAPLTGQLSSTDIATIDLVHEADIIERELVTLS